MQRDASENGILDSPKVLDQRNGDLTNLSAMHRAIWTTSVTTIASAMICIRARKNCTAKANTLLTFSLLWLLGIENELLLCMFVFIGSFIPVLGVLLSGGLCAYTLLVSDLAGRESGS